MATLWTPDKEIEDDDNRSFKKEGERAYPDWKGVNERINEILNTDQNIIEETKKKCLSPKNEIQAT